jgi:tetratricopeptide (TPR) repeat protein
MAERKRRPEQFDASGILRRAVALHREGRLQEAEPLYRQVLTRQPDNFDALHLCGVLQHQLGQPAEALKLIGRALRVNARSAPAYSNQGSVLAALGQTREALESYERALTLKPDYPEALNNRGNALRALRRHEEALASFDRALAVRPAYAEAHHNRGDTLFDLGRFDEALKSYTEALVCKPAHVAAAIGRAECLRRLGRPMEALAAFDAALTIKRDCLEALIGKGNIHYDLGVYAEAVAQYDLALAIRPDFAELHNNRGNALRQLGRPHEALASFDRAIALKPRYAEAHANRAIVHLRLNCAAQALADCDRAISLKSDYSYGWVNRANALQDLGRYTEAIASLDRAIALDPELAEAHWNKALAHLTLGEFEAGWQGYEWRWRRHGGPERRDFSQPLWRGEPLEGKTILLHAEQGFGDTIQFVRYVPLVAARGGRVVVEVPDSLKPLVESMSERAAVVGRSDSLPPFDVHCPLMSLPLALGTTLATIPAVMPYLRAPPERLEIWRTRLPPQPGLRVGLVWSGKPTHRNDHNRSLAFEQLAPLFAVEGVQFVSLQREYRVADLPALDACPALRRLDEALLDFADTAAVIEQLDLVISVDTAVAHLTGALGKPVWILLPAVPDWRWLLEREDSPWYPTARLFRQPQLGGWDSVITRLQQALSAFAVRWSQG